MVRTRQVTPTFGSEVRLPSAPVAGTCVFVGMSATNEGVVNSELISLGGIAAAKAPGVRSKEAKAKDF